MMKPLTKLKTGLAVSIVTLAMLAVPAGSFGVFGSQKASAAPGDWTTQYYATQNAASSACYNYASGGTGYCSGIAYVTSTTYTNSRSFVWRVVWQKGYCNMYVGINSANQITSRSWSGCSGFPLIPPPPFPG